MKVVIYNHGKFEFGTIIKSYYRQRVQRHDVLTERKIVLQGLSAERCSQCYIHTDYQSIADKTDIVTPTKYNL